MKDIKSYRFWDKISYDDKSIVLKNGDVFIYRVYYHSKCLNKDDRDSNSSTPLINA